MKKITEEFYYNPELDSFCILSKDSEKKQGFLVEFDFSLDEFETPTSFNVDECILIGVV